MVIRKKRGRLRKPISQLAKATRAGRYYRKAAKGTKPGTGKRFGIMIKALAMKGARKPKALAAWIGRRKYGKAGMAKMAVAGRKRARRSSTTTKRYM